MEERPERNDGKIIERDIENRTCVCKRGVIFEIS